MNYDRRILHSSVEKLGWRAAKLVTYDSGDHDLELNEAVTLPLQNGRKYYLIRADEWFLELLKVIVGSLGTFTGINNIGKNTRRITMEEVVTIIVGVWAVMELVKGGAVPFYVSRWIWWGMKGLFRVQGSSLDAN